MKKMMFYVLMLMGAVLQTPILVSMHPRELGALTQALPIEKQVRAKIPLTYLHIWDDLPYPMWNRPFYQSCDALFAISKQSNNIAKHVLGAENCFSLDEVENQPV